MKARRVRIAVVIGSLLAVASVAGGSSFAQTKIKPGFNLFSVEQDKEIGLKSAAEAERQLPILHDRQIDAFVTAVGKRLAASAPGAKYPYQFKVVNASDINAFALPGGYLYFNRGLLEAAKTEGQLAGVMAHEIAHVALRHGTNQASKAYLSQMGLGVMGGLIGKDGGSTAKTVNAIGGFGLNAMFLKFSRTDEEQADIVGAQTMARAGYNPQDMVDFFELLRSTQARDPGKVEQFFSSHPAPKDRASRIRTEMRALNIKPTQPVGGMTKVKSTLKALSPAQSTQQIAQATTGTTGSTALTAGGGRVAEVNVDRPSTSFRSFQQRGGFFRVDYPTNWSVYEPTNGYGATLAPPGGYVDTGGDERNLVYGVIINHYDPIDREASERFGSGGSVNYSTGFVDGSGRSISRTNLAQATNDLIAQILRSNPNLKISPNSQRTDTVSGAAALSLVLSGRSDVTEQEERVTLFTRELPDDDVIYALFIAPGQDYGELGKTFDRMISSLEVNDRAVHD
ncbi:MAG TPA: M48 family metallopeptidase [Candidatus Polarisedimenticolia bacterium]|jgi:Zn-dependent protease with chaperone function|nr:M48 family metallopeptidase [Candidatus Polarisedimenticolia bacterium]